MSGDMGRENMKGHQETIYSKCRLCGDEAEHKVYHAKEMFFGTGQEFAYFECDKCQCIQILEIPENLGEFYGERYYSFGKPDIHEPVSAARIETRILDVGCGAGKWLAEKYEQGHIHLSGCDPFIEKDIFYEPCIHIKKCTIHEIEGTFDLVHLSDSFEHMSDPLEVLHSVNRLLDENGMCLLSIPVIPNAAYDIFHENWYEWDAPRHLFLHSVKSIEYLCGKAGLKIENINYNSKIFQFISSMLYQKGIPYLEQSEEVIQKAFIQKEINGFMEATAELNKKGYGDHAVFVLVKQSK